MLGRSASDLSHISSNYIERFYFTGLMLKIEANIKVEMVEIYKVRGVLNFDYS